MDSVDWSTWWIPSCRPGIGGSLSIVPARASGRSRPASLGASRTSTLSFCPYTVLSVQSRGELDKFLAHAVGEEMHDRSGSGGPSVAYSCSIWSPAGFREAIVAGAYDAKHELRKKQETKNNRLTAVGRMSADFALVPMRTVSIRTPEYDQSCYHRRLRLLSYLLSLSL